MSTKKWKNEELKSLLSETWGFKMDLDKLNESKKGQLEEMGCPHEPGDEKPTVMTVVDGEEAGVTDTDDAEGLANELLALAQRVADMLGQESSISSLPDEGEADLEERRGRGRDREGMQPDARRRPMKESELRKMVKKIIKEKTKGN